MSPGLRRLTLLAHVAVSVGWLGAAVVFIGTSALALTSDDADTVRGAYLVMDPVASFVLVPLAIASLLTGLVQSLSTAWGLLRHYWVVFKLAINLFATALLLLYLQTFRSLADVASDRTADLSEVRNLSPLLHAVLAVVLLLAAVVLAVYKPRGLTPYGRRSA